MKGQTAAILMAQWRMLLNFYRRHGQVTFVVSVFLSAIWYGGFAGIAVFLAGALDDPGSLPLVRRYAGGALFFVFVYWQGMPLLMANIGGLLDLKKLKPYPVPETSFFRIELLLRTVVFLEMPLLMIGASIGLFRNPQLPKWCGFAPLLFAVFNIALGAGIRDLIARAFARKRVRELAILAMVLLAAVPSLLARRTDGFKIGRWLERLPTEYLPWSSAGKAATSESSPMAWLALAVVAALAWVFGRWQFHRSFHFDSESERAAEPRERQSRSEFLWTWPRYVFRDPLAALVEKEIRSLSRISRFRIVFFMGFTFGLIIWLPLAGRTGSSGMMARSFLSIVAAYALVLLSEVCFYNAFGFDRAAAQMYFLAPVSHRTVLVAKNIAAAWFVVAEMTLVTMACTLFRMPVDGPKIAEAAAVCLVMTLFFLGIGNLGSTRSPRGQNPNDGWKRTSGSKMAFIAFLFYPLIGMPVALAYLARYAFEAQWAFFAVLGVGGIVAATFYWVSLDSAAETLVRDKERFLTLLSQSDSPAI